MKKRIRLTESELTNLIEKIVKEKSLVNEQLTLLARPLENLSIGPSSVSNKAIKLSYKNPQTKKTEYLRYDINATYTGIGFEVELRNIKRESDGALTAEALPSNSIVKFALKKLVADKFKTKDGWLTVKVPKQKIEEAIVTLKKNKGQTATIDAGNGVSIVLKLSEVGK